MSVRRCAKNSLASVRIRRDAKNRPASVSMKCDSKKIWPI